MPKRRKYSSENRTAASSFLPRDGQRRFVGREKVFDYHQTTRNPPISQPDDGPSRRMNDYAFVDPPEERSQHGQERNRSGDMRRPATVNRRQSLNMTERPGRPSHYQRRQISQRRQSLPRGNWERPNENQQGTFNKKQQGTYNENWHVPGSLRSDNLVQSKGNKVGGNQIRTPLLNYLLTSSSGEPGMGLPLTDPNLPPAAEAENCNNNNNQEQQSTSRNHRHQQQQQKTQKTYPSSPSSSSSSSFSNDNKHYNTDDDVDNNNNNDDGDDDDDDIGRPLVIVAAESSTSSCSKAAAAKTMANKAGSSSNISNQGRERLNNGNNRTSASSSSSYPQQNDEWPTSSSKGNEKLIMTIHGHAAGNDRRRDHHSNDNNNNKRRRSYDEDDDNNEKGGAGERRNGGDEGGKYDHYGKKLEPDAEQMDKFSSSYRHGQHSSSSRSVFPAKIPTVHDHNHNNRHQAPIGHFHHTPPIILNGTRRGSAAIETEEPKMRAGGIVKKEASWRQKHPRSAETIKSEHTLVPPTSSSNKFDDDNYLLHSTDLPDQIFHFIRDGIATELAKRETEIDQEVNRRVTAVQSQLQAGIDGEVNRRVTALRSQLEVEIQLQTQMKQQCDMENMKMREEALSKCQELEKKLAEQMSLNDDDERKSEKKEKSEERKRSLRPRMKP